MIQIQITNHFEQFPADGSKLKKLVRTICKRFEVSQARISIGIVDDAEIIALNRKFLNHKGTTDSLSFDLSDGAGPDESKVFDLIVNGELATREAVRRGHDASAELALYIAHGLLHHLGFDDATPEQADEMHRTEDEILQRLGYGWVYDKQRRAP
jgi:probable rRNA maturation factor